MNILAYHGTDYSIAKKIIKEGFIFKPNREHWLGNGIYFYQDFSLAKWWTTNPTKRFGSNIQKPAIISCHINVNESRVLNLLKLEDYCQFSAIFEREFWPKYKGGNPIVEPSWKQLRCAYCDYLKRIYELDAIIGNFNKQDQPYLPSKHSKEFEKFYCGIPKFKFAFLIKKLLQK